MKLIDITNNKFNRLKAIKFIKISPSKKHYWLFKCDCGKEKIISKRSVMSGHIQSCGCKLIQWRKEPKTHGKSNTNIYWIYTSMLQRCLNPKGKAFKNYGGRGITVCKRWLKFENFYKDMGDRPNQHSLERINNNKDYSPNNCKWATYKEQNRNQRSNILLTFKNKTKCLSDWASETGIDRRKISYRIKHNWPIEKALTT